VVFELFLLVSLCWPPDLWVAILGIGFLIFLLCHLYFIGKLFGNFKKSVSKFKDGRRYEMVFGWKI